MKVLLDIDEEYYNQVVMSNTKVGEFLRKGRPINDHVTVTNGDVIKALFPQIKNENIHFYDEGLLKGQVSIYIPNEANISIYDIRWWNAPYED